MKTRLILFFLGALTEILNQGCSIKPQNKGPSAPQFQTIHRVTLEHIRNSLPPQAVPIGFDIDDTLFFSSPGFYYGLTNTNGPGGTNQYGNAFLDNIIFWKDMNSKFEDFSIPKQAAKNAIALHKSRGDSLYFITARPSTPGERLNQRIKKVFHLDSMNPVIFMADKPKTEVIKKLKLVLFYGDSDSDIRWAQAGQARAIRFLRSRNTVDPTTVNIGAFGEEVLADSDY